MSDINLIISATDQASAALKGINTNLDAVSNKANNTGGSFTGMGGKMKAALGIAGAAFAAFKGIAVVSDKIADMDELAKRARAVGSASEAGFAQFQVASQLLAEGGLSAAEADRAFNNLQLRLAQGQEGSKAYAGIFEKLGDSVKDANGNLLEAPGLFEAVGSAVQDGTLTLDEASKVLGQRVGPKIVGIFDDLAAKGVSTKDALADVAANTNIVPLEAATNAEAFGDTVERIKQVLGQLMTDAITPLLPLLVKMADEVLANLPPVIEKVQAGFKKLEPVFDTMGMVLTELVFPILGKVFDIIVSLATAIAPLVEKSIPLLKQGFELVASIIETVVEKITAVIDTIQNVGETISNFTGGVTDKVGGMKDAVVGTMGDMAEGMTSKAREASDGVLKWLGFAKNEAVDNSIVPDMVRDIIAEMDKMAIGMTEKTRQAAQGVLRELNMLKEGATIDMSILNPDQLSDVEYFTNISEEMNKAQKQTETQTRRSSMALDIMDGMLASGTGNIGQYAEAYEKFGVTTESTTSRAVMSAKQIGDSFGQMGSTIASTFTDVLMGTKDGFESLQDIALSVVKTIVQTLIQNFIVNPLLKNIQGAIMGISGGGGGGGGGFGSMIGSALFGPVGGFLGGLLGFADGGNTAKAGRKPILVGERGPEVFLPGRAGTVVTNEELNSSGGNGDLNVNFTINAIDTQTGVQFLVENKRVITGVIQEAYQRRGTQGPLG